MRKKKQAVSAFAPKKRPGVQRAPPSRPTSAHAPNGQPVTNGVTTTSRPEIDHGPYIDFPIMINKKELLRHHSAKFFGKAGVDGNMEMIDPYNPEQFTRPLRLQRRYMGEKLDVEDEDAPASGADDKDREAYKFKRAERDAEREANKAQIAPGGNPSKAPLRKKRQQKKVEDVWYDESNEAQREKRQVRYEETKLWHLDDYENKQQWRGSYTEALSESYVMFEVGEGGFTMVPIERHYQFRPINKTKALTLEEAEKHMTKKVKPQRWFMGTQQGKAEAQAEANRIKKERILANRRGGDDDVQIKDEREEYQADRDDLDFEWNDEFQDDDEGMIFGDDDEARDAEQRIREERREANLAGTGLKNEEKDYDEEEEKKKEEERAERKLEKSLRKQLIKKERKYEYDSDDSDNPYASSSETEDSDEERERLEKERKEKEERDKLQVNGDKSGASTKGTNTPTGRSEKRDPSRTNAMLGASLKRPGSPNLSEASGNESSRKKAKGVNGRATSLNLPNGARSLSRKFTLILLVLVDMIANDLTADAASNIQRTGTGGYGSGSETDTSRAGRPKIRLKASPPGSPQDKSPNGSRAVSPAASRAQSPNRVSTPPQRTATPPVTLPTLEEIKAKIPAEGITVKELTDSFKGRVSKPGMTTFIGLVKQAGKQDPTTKKIVPKEIVPKDVVPKE